MVNSQKGVSTSAFPMEIHPSGFYPYVETAIGNKCVLDILRQPEPKKSTNTTANIQIFDLSRYHISTSLLTLRYYAKA